jgi:lipopolysaccharide export system protein LptA
MIALLLVMAPAHALKNDANQPINIRAKSVDASEKTGVTRYRGKVVLTQGSLRLDAERLEVSTRNGRTHLVRAWGNPVRVQSRTDAGDAIEAHAARTEYYVSDRRLDLYDEVVLRRNDDTVSGGIVRYDFATQSFTAEGGDGVVSAIIQPESQETRP